MNTMDINSYFIKEEIKVLISVIDNRTGIDQEASDPPFLKVCSSKKQG